MSSQEGVLMEQEQGRITLSTKGDYIVIRFQDTDLVDEVNLHEVGKVMYAVVERSPGIKLVVDFEGVLFVCSSAFGKLISLKKKVAENSGTLKLCNIRPEILEFFKVTRLDTVFDIYPDLDAAVR
jgi:anti-sigma B factor antagonist